MKKKNRLDAEARLAFATFKNSKSDVYTWAVRNILLPGRRPWDMADRLWQLQILQDPSHKIVEKKSAQVGLTTVNLVKILHYLNYHSATAMYTLPRRDDFALFVSTTLDPVIKNSPLLSEAIADTDSVRIKAFNFPGGIDSMFSLAEVTVEPRMIPVDLLANDEIDRTREDSEDFLSQFVARLANSSDPHHFQFSTPTVPGWGIDKLYEDTTQNEWMVTCPGCSQEQMLDWEKNFLPDPPRYVCASCHNLLPDDTIINGKWVAMYPGRDITGYHVSNMMMPISRPPKELYTELSSNRLSTKNFYNLRMGLAYSSATGSFTRELFRQKCFDVSYQREQDPGAMGGYFMGVDQGNDVHVVVARREGKRCRIVHAEKILEKSDVKWSRKVINLIRRFHVEICVVDALPNTHDARDIVKEFANEGERVWLCHYSTQEEPLKTNKEDNKVHVQKTEMFDALRTEIADGAWKLWGSFDSGDSIVDAIINHFTNLKRDEREAPNGKVSGVWINTGPDHYAHGCCYARIAMLLSNSGRYQIVDLSSPPEDANAESQERENLYKVWPSLRGSLDDESITEDN